jgi:Tfp pilus assembly protein PilF
VNLASLLVSMNRLNEAVPHFERALQTVDAATAPDIHNNFGIVLAMLGRLDQATAQFSEAVRLRPDFAAAKVNLARARSGGR